MNKILEMIKNEKVEWKKLGDVCEIKTGKLNANAKVEGGKYLFFTTSQEVSYIDEYAFEGESLLIAGNANVGDVKYYNGKFNAYQRVYVLQEFECVNAKFLMHFMKEKLKIYLDSKKKQSAMTYIVLKDLQNFEIPIPSMVTQGKIVKILDTMVDHFTQLQAELQAELQARNRQYEHYRDKLLSEEYLNKLSENRNIKKARLCEIAQLNRGKRVVRNQLSGEGLYPVFQNSLTPLGFYDNKNFSGEKTCIITAGAAGDIFYQNKDFWAADDVFVITTDVAINKYLYYCILNKQYILKSKVRRASVPRLSRESIEGLEIFIPPIPVQEHIVSILDNFNNIVNDINEGLPKEIELRQKQYEYYRERLLDYKREED